MCGSDLWVGLHRAKAVTRALSALCWKIRAEIFGRFGKWFAIAFTCAMALGVVACSESAPVLPAQFSPNAMANTVQPQDFEQVAHQLWRRQLSTVMPPGPLRLLETVNLGHAGKPRVYVVTGTDGDFYIVVQLLAETIFKDILGTLVRVMRVDDTGTILWQNLGVQTYLQGSVDRTDAPLTVTALSGGGIELFYEHFWEVPSFRARRDRSARDPASPNKLLRRRVICDGSSDALGRRRNSPPRSFRRAPLQRTW